MPYSVGRQGGQWCVLGPDGPVDGGCHPNRGEAVAHLKALYAHVPDARPVPAGNSGHTSAMLALIPSDKDAARLALDGGEAASGLHVTLAFLGKAENHGQMNQYAVHDAAGYLASMSAVDANVFGHATFNPDGDEPAHVLSVGDAGGHDGPQGHGPLAAIHNETMANLSSALGEDMPAQHTPWVAHMTLAYGDPVSPEDMTGRIGPVHFDRIRVAFGDDVVDYALAPPAAPEVEVCAPAEGDHCPPDVAPAPVPSIPVNEQASPGVPSDGMDLAVASPALTGRPWAGPVAFEGEATGDDRIFAPGSITWDEGNLPMPFSWQRVSDSGHKSSVVIGRVDGFMRLGNEILGHGIVFDGENAPDECSQFLGLMDGGVGRWVSVDGDSADFVDLTDEATGDVTRVFSEMRLRGLTAVSISAFQDAQIAMVASAADGSQPLNLFEGATIFALTASVVGDTSIPMGTRDEHFDGLAAQKRIFEWAKSGDGLDPAKLKRVFLWQDSAADPQNRTAYKLPFADIIDGSPKAFPKAVFAAAQAVEGARGGLSVPDADKVGIRAKLDTLYGKINGSKLQDDPEARPPWKNNAGDKRSTGLAVEGVALDVESTEELAAVITLAKAKAKKKAKKPAFPGAAAPFAADTIVAAAIPVKPPLAWMQNPHFAEETPVTITPDGQIFGHLAPADQCHIGMGQCTTPRENLMGYSDYAYFHVGELETAEGEFVSVGHMTFQTGHADTDPSVTARAAAAHYDNTGTVAADVRAGEDEFGIWIAGALRPSMTDESIREFRSAPPSGDWRRIGGRLEMVAALAVNTPGFPVRRRVLVASGDREMALIFTPSAPEEIDEARHSTRLRLKQRIVNSVVKQEGI